MKKKLLLIIAVGCVAIVMVIFAWEKNTQAVSEENKIIEEERQLYDVGVYDASKEGYDYLSTDNVISEEALEDKAQQLAEIYEDKEADEIYKSMSENEIEEKALYLAALDSGITVTEEEVDEVIKTVQDSIKGTEEEKELKSYMLGAGMSEEEYWTNVRGVYERNLIISKYKEQLQEEDIEVKDIVQEKVEEYDVHIEKTADTSVTINADKVTKVDVQFKDEVVTITDKEDVDQILEMIADNKKESSETGKGWTYRLIFKDKDDEKIADIMVLDDDYIIYDNMKYSCSHLSIDKLDDISGIDRQ